MSLEPINTLRSLTIVMPQENIDTDQIIPARYLTTTTREGLGKMLFYDWRYDVQGNEKREAVLNNIDPEGHAILIGGHNFGCGSSREHAPWALADYGFKAVLSTKIADIFKSNAIKNGILAIEVSPEAHAWLVDNPGAEVEIDLEEKKVRLPNQMVEHFDIEAFGRRCLLDGVDPLGFLQNALVQVEQYEASHGKAA
jgi:3-isopropylmalate/(R)-2-methylmalate dehydratase small subunit